MKRLLTPLCGVVWLALAALMASCGGHNKYSDYLETGRTAELIPVKDAETKLFGYINAKGEQVIAPRFVSVAYFHDKLALVEDTCGLCGYIRPDGTYAIEPKYASACDFLNGLAWVSEPDSCLRAIDTRGNVVFRFPKASQVTGFATGYALYNATDGSNGIIDTKGNEIVLPPGISVYRSLSQRQRSCHSRSRG